MNKNYKIVKAWLDFPWLIPTEEPNENLEREWKSFVEDCITEMITWYSDNIIRKGLTEVEQKGMVKTQHTPLKDLMKIPCMIDPTLYKNRTFCCVEQNGLLFLPLEFDCDDEEIQDTERLWLWGVQFDPYKMTMEDMKFGVDDAYSLNEGYFWMDAKTFCNNYMKDFVNMYFEKMTGIEV